MKDKKKDGYNSIGLSLEIDGHNNNDNRINNINNNIDNSLLMNNTINKNKKSLAFIKDFSKYKRKIVWFIKLKILLEIFIYIYM